MADQICLRYNGVSSILELRCPLAHCCDICLTHGVRSQPPQRLESTSLCTFISPRDIVTCAIARFCFLDGILAANDSALLVYLL